MNEHTLDCDVLIVGGGPAGLSVAAALPDHVSSIVVHQDHEIGRPVRTSGGCWLRDAEKLGIPPRFYQVVNTLDIYSDNQHTQSKPTSETLIVLNITELYQWLAQKSDHKNRRLICATKFLSTQKDADGHYVSAVRSRTTATQNIRSKYIIDGSGVRHAVLEDQGLRDAPARTGTGIEYEYPIGNNQSDRAILFVGSSVLSGYGWVFPTADHKLRVGVGVIDPDTDVSPRTLMTQFLASKDIKRFGLELGDEYEVNAGTIPSEPYDPELVFGNIIRVGDSANFATPTVGEGIRICIEHGANLGQALTETIKTKSDKPLKAYEADCKKALAKNYRFGFLANQRFSRYDPQDWDKSIKRLSYVDEKTLMAMLRSEFSIPMIARTIFKALQFKIFGAGGGT